ncbi:MAG: hypothetical protein ACE5KI_04350, partial [Dehalococcoidia bacterium]
ADPGELSSTSNTDTIESLAFRLIGPRAGYGTGGLDAPQSVVGVTFITGGNFPVPAAHVPYPRGSLDGLDSYVGPRSWGVDGGFEALPLIGFPYSYSNLPVVGAHVPSPFGLASLTERIGPRDGSTGSFKQAIVTDYTSNLPVAGAHVPYPAAQVSITEMVGPRAGDDLAGFLNQGGSTDSMLMVERIGPRSWSIWDVTGGNLPVVGFHVPLNR